MMEQKNIHRLCPCHRYDLEGIQTWLEDMAKDGWILEKGSYGLGLFTFERGEPCTCRYRIQVTTDTSVYGKRQEYLDLLNDCGWFYVTDFHGFDIFRTEDPNAIELNTDPAIQANTLKKLKKESIVRLLFLAFYLLMVQFRNLFDFLYLFRSTVTMGPFSVVVFFSFLLIAFSIPVFDLWMIRRLEKTLRSGTLLCQRKDWQKNPLRYRFYDLLPLLSGIVVICVLIGYFVMSSDRQVLDSHTADPPFVTVEDLSDSGYEALDPFFGSNYYVRWSNSVAPVNYEWREYGSIEFEGKSTKGQLILYYHETISPWIARGLADDYYAYETSKMGYVLDQEVSDYGLDQVRVFGDSVTHILICHENTVILALYNQWDTGKTPDWQIWLEAMAEKLLNNA